MDDFEILNLMIQETNFINGYQPRFVSFRNIGLNKRPTREQKKPIHDRPERMLKLNSTASIEFNKLVGK